MSPDDPTMQQDMAPAASLRSAKPTWAKNRLASVEPRQRVIVFMAGGASYSEARACYDVSNKTSRDVSNKTSRDVFLVTSHMVKPQFYLRQLGDLSQSRRSLRLPLDGPQPKAPAHLFEKPEPPKPTPAPPGAKPSIPGGLPSGPKAGGAPKPPTTQLGSINLNAPPSTSSSSSKHKDDKDKDKDKKKHKKLHLFGSKH